MKKSHLGHTPATFAAIALSLASLSGLHAQSGVSGGGSSSSGSSGTNSPTTDDAQSSEKKKKMQQ